MALLAETLSYSILDADVVEVVIVNDVDIDDIFFLVHYVLRDMRRLSSVLRRGCATLGEVAFQMMHW